MPALHNKVGGNSLKKIKINLSTFLCKNVNISFSKKSVKSMWFKDISMYSWPISTSDFQIEFIGKVWSQWLLFLKVIFGETTFLNSIML